MITCMTNAPGAAKLVKEVGRYGFRQVEFNSPWFLDTSPAGDILIADTDNHRIQILDANTHVTLAFPYGLRGSQWGQLAYPRSVKFSPILASHLAIADTGNSRIVFAKIRPDGFVEQQHEIGRTLLRQPSDLAFDAGRKMIYVTDTSQNAVLVLDANGNYVTQCPPDRPLNQPTGIARDLHGRVFVADSGNNCVRVFAPNGDYITSLTGTASSGGGCSLSCPRGVCVDSRGRVYVADQLNDRVVTFAPDLQVLAVAASGVPQPKGLAAHNDLYVTTADCYNVLKVYKV